MGNILGAQGEASNAVDAVNADDLQAQLEEENLNTSKWWASHQNTL